MLRLVHPPPGGNASPAPARRKGRRPDVLSLTPDETRNVRTAIRGAARVLGSLAALARAVGIKPGTLSSKRRPSAGLALAVSRVAGLSLDAMLSGKLVDAGTCPACGGKRAPVPGGAP